MITHEELFKVLDYNTSTGVFTWKIKTGRINIGCNAGCFDKDGYIIIKINYKSYKAHRLAWFYVYGTLPKNPIDHINGVPHDNKIHNLRSATYRQNQQNRITHRTGRLVGCYYNKSKKKWVASIRLNKIPTHLGYFKTEIEAHRAYLKELNKI